MNFTEGMSKLAKGISVEGKRYNSDHKTNTPKEIRDLWQTPKFVFSHYQKRFKLTMDVAASEENSLLDVFYTEKDNALENNWSVFW